MIKTKSVHHTVIFDEVGCDHVNFEKFDVAKDLITNYIECIHLIEFFSVEKIIIFNTRRFDEAAILNGPPVLNSHWFRNIDNDFLNFLCNTPELRNPVKHFFIHAKFHSFSVEKYPLLAAVLLGNNNEH
jgi:hypothetical protein